MKIHYTTKRIRVLVAKNGLIDLDDDIVIRKDAAYRVLHIGEFYVVVVAEGGRAITLDKSLFYEDKV